MEVNKFILSTEALARIDGGVWIKDLEGADGVELLVTGLSAKAAQDLIFKKQEALRKDNNGSPLTTQQYAQLMREVIAEAVLLDWKGITQNGKPVKYSKELAKEWIVADEGRRGEKFTDLVRIAAQQVDHTSNDYVETVSKK